MIDGRPATLREDVAFWVMALLCSIPGVAAYAAIVWFAGAWL